MKLFLVSLCIAVCSAARLDNTYLPPGSAHSAGGSGSILSAPRGSAFGQRSQGSSFGKSFGFRGQSAVNRPFPAAPAPAPAATYGGPQSNFRSAGQDIPILKLNNENFGDGSYRFEYETGNGISAQESGQLKQVGPEGANEVHGDFSYTGDDGQHYSISYLADENGFQPQGAHLPTPPPIPEAILRSLEQNAAEEARNPQRSSDDGAYHEDSQQNGYSRGSGGHSTFGAQGGFGNAASKQYLAPRKPSFNSNTGYNY